jgi:predicted N-acetyltransferase YhbS
VSAFVLDAAGRRAEEVIAASTTTVVPARFFDTLHAALDRTPRPNPALARRAAAKRRVVQR